MIAFLFPGQGSQKRGMGLGLFDEVVEYKTVEKNVDALLGYSMRQLCLEDPQNLLKETQYTQPSLYVVNALHYYAARRRGERASYLAGHSLGEYNALLAGESFDFLAGLSLVKKRGELMAQAKNGGMGAVIGLSSEKILRVIDDSDLKSLDVANFNSPSQTVVSGPLADLKRAGPIFEKAGAKLFMPLPVSAAFHSRQMADAARSFADFLAPMSFAAPKIPVVANATARPYPSVDASDAIKSLLVKQITGSVRWIQSITFLRENGVKEFKETGPGNVLMRLFQQVLEVNNAI
jgi:malonyl CoA-acyl carrier protein transacylase